MIDHHPEPSPIPVDDTVMRDAYDWMLQLEEEEECSQEFCDYETIVIE
jgi:hypothetical protein